MPHRRLTALAAVLSCTSLVLVTAAWSAPARSSAPSRASSSAPSLSTSGRTVMVRNVPAKQKAVRFYDATGAKAVHLGTDKKAPFSFTYPSSARAVQVRLGGSHPRLRTSLRRAPAPKAPAFGAVLFSEDFSGTGTYDHTKFTEWSACTYAGSAAYGEIKCGDRSRLNGEGQLIIPATPTEGTSISTKDTFRFVYGTITARMKIQTQEGYWPAFWTLNAQSNGQPNNGLVGEADVLEAYTQFDDGYRSGTHNYADGTDNGNGDKSPLCSPGDDVRGEWHDYSMRIEPDKITSLVDGQVCETFTKADLAGKPYAFGPDNLAGNFLILSNAVGNSGHGMRPPTQDSRLLVDSVVVTAL